MKQIKIKSDIVDNDTGKFYEWFGLGATYPEQIETALNDSDDDVVVDINSRGGDVFAASEIYTLLAQYPGNVTVNIQGLAASAASVIAMAGDKVRISPTAQLMIHKAWTATSGNSDDLQQESAVLNGIDESIINAYEAKTGLERTELLKMMAQESWLTAQDAVDKGFADEVITFNATPQILNTYQAPKIAKDKIEQWKQVMAKAKAYDDSHKKIANEDELQAKISLLF
ncbi:head maturation protease, ClpP-related [Ligilactobacillus saerimneri]|uniref:head maturation protease, ClpP-related n=1 Tax=Ligilactobacillus saerimneri TaxID=228229 RepID=UPI00374D2C3E